MIETATAIAEEQEPQAEPESLKESPVEKIAKRPRATRQTDLRRQEAFVIAYTTPTAPEFLQARKAAITAGYKEKYAASVASRLQKKPRIKGMIDVAMAEISKKLTAEEVTVEFVERKHVEAMARCLLAGDRTNEREHLECLGKMKGAYDVSLHLDLTVKHEYDERLALEASRLARLALEEAGDRALGLPAGVVEVEVHDGTLEDDLSGPISSPGVSGAGCEVDRSTGGTPERQAQGGEGTSEDLGVRKPSEEDWDPVAGGGASTVGADDDGA